MKNPQLILAFFWPLKLIKTLFTYFNDKIKPKPSPDGTLSPNTILVSDGRYCTVILHFYLCITNPFRKVSGFYSSEEQGEKILIDPSKRDENQKKLVGKCISTRSSNFFLGMIILDWCDHETERICSHLKQAHLINICNKEKI